LSGCNEDAGRFGSKWLWHDGCFVDAPEDGVLLADMSFHERVERALFTLIQAFLEAI